MNKLTDKERKFFDLATAGGLDLSAAYAIAYRSSGGRSLTNSLSRKKKLKPELFREIDNYKQNLYDLATKTQAEEMEKLVRDRIATQIELEAMLSEIAMGRFLRKRIVTGIDVKSGKIVKGEIEETPTESEMISAADKLLKIKGAYARDNVVKHEAGDTFIEALKAISQRKKKGGVQS